MFKKPLLLSVLSLFIAGCGVITPIYLPGGKVDDEAVLADIEAKATNREKVTSLLGKPTVSRRDGRFVVYTKRQHGGGWAWGHFSAGTYYQPTIIILYNEFDSVDEIKTKILERTFSDFDRESLIPQVICVKNGECVRVYEWEVDSNRWPVVDVFSSPLEDRIEKEFRPVDGYCSVYIYIDWGSEPTIREQASGISQRATVAINGADIGPVPYDGYVRKIFSSGSNYDMIGRSIYVKKAEFPEQSNTFYCSPNDVLFLKLERFFPYKFYSAGRKYFSPIIVDGEEGRSSIMKRKLVILD